MSVSDNNRPEGARRALPTHLARATRAARWREQRASATSKQRARPNGCRSRGLSPGPKADPSRAKPAKLGVQAQGCVADPNRVRGWSPRYSTWPKACGPEPNPRYEGSCGPTDHPAPSARSQPSANAPLRGLFHRLCYCSPSAKYPVGIRPAGPPKRLAEGRSGSRVAKRSLP